MEYEIPEFDRRRMDAIHRVRGLREARGWSREDLNRAIYRAEDSHDGMTFGYRHDYAGIWEECLHPDDLPSFTLYMILAKVLDTSADYLLGLTDDPRAIWTMR